VSESADEYEEGTGDAEDTGAEEDAQGALDEMLETIRQAKVGPLILSTVSTFASVAYGKLEMKDLAEAKTAIDVIDALLPLLGGDVDEDIRRDFAQALTNLKLAYADAVAAAE
jgi:hypothetical protein